MVLLADSEGPDQTVQICRLGFRHSHMSVNRFPHGAANILEGHRSETYA